MTTLFLLTPSNFISLSLLPGSVDLFVLCFTVEVAVVQLVKDTTSTSSLSFFSIWLAYSVVAFCLAVVNSGYGMNSPTECAEARQADRPFNIFILVIWINCMDNYSLVLAWGDRFFLFFSQRILYFDCHQTKRFPTNLTYFSVIYKLFF